MTSLPVVTIADAGRFGRDREYAIGIAEKALGYLLEIDLHRGTGRIYV